MPSASAQLIIDHDLLRSVPNEGTATNTARSDGSGATTIPARAPQPPIAPNPAANRATSPLIRRLAPLPSITPTHPVGPSNPTDSPVEPIESSTRSTTRILPGGIAKDALPVKVIDVPGYLLGGNKKKDRNNWKNRVIIELGNPNYKGAFAPTREKGPDGKWIAAGLELHIYDSGERDPPALPTEIHRDLLKEGATMRNVNQITEEASAPAESNSNDTSIPNEQTRTSTHWEDTLSTVLESLVRQRSSSSALASQQSVCLENTTEHNGTPTSPERNSTQRSAPSFHSSTTSAVRSNQYVSNHKQPVSSAYFVPIANLGRSPEAHLPRTVAPMRLSRSTLFPEEPVLLSANIPALSTSHSSAPLIIKSKPESEPVVAPRPDSLPKAVLPQPSLRPAKQAEPTHSLQQFEFDSSFCSGSNSVESLSDMARGFLRRYVCVAHPFALLMSPKVLRILGQH